MAAFTESLINKVDTFGMRDKNYGNIVEGSQFGLGLSMPKIDAATPLMLPNAQIVVTHTPTMFDGIEGASEILCALVEKYASSVSNISPSLSIAVHDGVKLQNKQTVKIPGTSGYSDLAPTFVYKEIIGNLVYQFHETWTKMIGHPDSGYSALSSIFKAESVPPFVYSYFSMDIAVLQPDITLMPENLIDGFFLTCMFPTNLGEIGIKRELGSDGQVPERSIEFASVLVRNANTYAVCRKIMELLQFHKVDFDKAIPPTLEIESKLTEVGIAKEIEEIKAEFMNI